MKLLRLFGIFVGLAALLVGCRLSGSGTNNNGPDLYNNNNQDGDGSTGPDAATGPVVYLQGTVLGPGGDFPVSGALVAAYPIPPDPIPSVVYCEPCAEPGVAHAFSEPDGTFELAVTAGGHYYLVTQKGQFRRVREYDAPPGGGTFLLDQETTTLPSRTDAAMGDTIPNIALATGSYDDMEDIFGKVDMGQVDASGAFIWGSENGIFDAYYNGGESVPQNFETLLADLTAMKNYHIIFAPCSSNNPAIEDPVIQQNIRDYVWDGGKWYIADWSYEFVEFVWPEFLEFTGDSGSACDQTSLGSCDHGPSFDSDGHAVDPDLKAWLEAMGIFDNDLALLENWDTIGSIAASFVGYDPEHGTGPNGELYLEPKVWVEGPIPWNMGMSTEDHPLTLSWPYNCGRVLFTTYHSVGEMSGPHVGLLPQEMILFYLVMEIGLCQDDVIVE